MDMLEINYLTRMTRHDTTECQLSLKFVGDDTCIVGEKYKVVQEFDM